MTTNVAIRASPSTSSAMISRGFATLDDLFEDRQEVAEVADLLLVDQDVGNLRGRTPSPSACHIDEVRRDDSPCRTACLRRFRRWSRWCLPSSTVITPSLPTRSSASASSSPIASLSLLALIAPTLSDLSPCWKPAWPSSASGDSALRDRLRSMPRRIAAIGLLPATMLRMPSLKIARASTVAVVVPSPAIDEVLLGDFIDQLGHPCSRSGLPVRLLC